MSRPKTIKDPSGKTYEVYFNQYIGDGEHIFVEMTPEDGEATGMTTYRGRTSGGDPIGVTGSECMIYSDIVVESVMVDVTDAGWEVVEYKEA